MVDAISDGDRYRILARYHRDIFSDIEQSKLQGAVRLLFDFAAEYCPNFESEVANLSAEYHNVINAPKAAGGDHLLFLQSFHKLWIAMEDFVLATLPSEAAPDDDSMSEDQRPLDRERAVDLGSLLDLKKALLARSVDGRVPCAELREVTRKRGAKFNLGPVTLMVPPGQIIGVVGPNGGGKTTLLRLIAADLAQSSGEIAFPGLDSKGVGNRPPRREYWPSIRSKIAYVPPERTPISHDTVEALWKTGAAHGLRSGELERRIKVTMHKYGLDQYADTWVSALSTGFRLRFELARILFADPTLLILDEPLANLDRNAQLKVLEDLKLLAASIDMPRSVVISSQHIEEIASISDHVLFLSDGKVLFSGPPKDVAAVLDYAVFEISVLERPGQFQQFLLKLGAVETDQTAISVFALFPKGTELDMVIKAMHDADFRVKSFRDLSNSIEVLMLMPRFGSMLRAKPVGRTPQNSDDAKHGGRA
jgi:ABC-2 type transport system ATP-binding protein